MVIGAALTINSARIELAYHFPKSLAATATQTSRLQTPRGKVGPEIVESTEIVHNKKLTDGGCHHVKSQLSSKFYQKSKQFRFNIVVI
jgi:hypothetical protein